MRPSRPQQRRRASAAAIALVAVTWIAPGAAGAHMAAKAIEEWGPFNLDAVICVRLMTRAVHACFSEVVALEGGCRDRLVHGKGCDDAEVQTQVEAAARDARLAVAAACSEGVLTEVGYFGLVDANADLLNACVTQGRAAIEATYAPARSGQSSAAALACMSEAAGYGAKVMRFSLERQTPVFERMTTRVFQGPAKSEMVRLMRIDISETRQRWIAGLTQACPDFAAIYGRSAESFLRTLAQRTDCVLSKTYVNGAVTCVAQQCGNGIQEGEEQCDDGNADDGDGCRTDCRLSP